MVGRTKLIRTTGSPLIGGYTKTRSHAGWWITAAIVIVLGVTAVWYFFLR